MARLAPALCTVLLTPLYAQFPRFDIGDVSFRPGGFFEVTSLYRSTAIPAASISTPYPSLPLGASGGEYKTSLAHSRVQLHSEAPLGNVRAIVYLEADFLQAANRAPWRWRQYWAEIRFGRWHVTGGQAWSLLRPNRKGISSENELMNTLVIEPAYHVGLAGVRRHSLQLTRDLGTNSAFAVEWATRGEFTAKLAHDAKSGHFEIMGGGGTRGRVGFGLAQVVHAGPRVNVVGQQFWSRGLGPELLNILPARVRTLSALEGLEVRATERLTLFGYGGIVYGSRSGGNRLERQWTAGALHRVYRNAYGTMQLSAQFSEVDRAVWSGRHGSMWYWMASGRWLLPTGVQSGR